MKYNRLLLLLLISFSAFSQQRTRETIPVYPGCEPQSTQLESCFYNNVQNFIFDNFQVPDDLKNSEFKDVVTVLFEVDTVGVFKVLYVNAIDASLITESKRVFQALPKVQPASYNGRPTYAKFTININIPLQSANSVSHKNQYVENTPQRRGKFFKEHVPELKEFDSIVYKRFNNPQLSSHLNVPFSHSYYSRFDAAMNQIGSNNHTASKPYTYSEVAKYYDLQQWQESIAKKGTNWFARKFWNENFVEIQGENYWFTFNPILDLQLGKSFGDKDVSTFVNTRGIQFRGGLGDQLTFSTTIYESQGRFADYYNMYAESIRPSGGNPAIIPGIGIAKGFKEDAYDFPTAEASLTFTPSKFLNLELGYGRNFIGDGYRSLLEGDGASPYPYFKANTTFWKIKYTNTYVWMKDVRPEATLEKTYSTKYMANHYLSWNVTKRFNLGLFESVVWANTNNRGYDINFVNPLIFYRAVEFSSSPKTGNALLGATFKYKWNSQLNFYGQFLLDEFSLSDVKERDKSWKNKYGYQVGAKYYNAFSIDNLYIQLEYNRVRPYVYSHSDPLTNYAHNNQSVGHQWGGNFKEFIAVARYNKGRYFADAKVTFGKRGLDFNTATDSLNYGGNIYRGYNENRARDKNAYVGQGNETSIFIADLQAGYVINPSTNLKLFGNVIFRNFDPLENTETAFKQTTTWFSLGVRSDIFNWYYDY